MREQWAWITEVNFVKNSDVSDNDELSSVFIEIEDSDIGIDVLEISDTEISSIFVEDKNCEVSSTDEISNVFIEIENSEISHTDENSKISDTDWNSEISDNDNMLTSLKMKSLGNIKTIVM